MKNLLLYIIILFGVFGFFTSCSNPLVNNGGTTTTTIEIVENEKIDTSRLNLGLYIAGRELTQRVESSNSPWNEKSVITGYYPIYTPGIDGVSHYEFKISTDGKDAGYILVSVTENDIEIPELAEYGLTTTETYRNALNKTDFRVYRYNWFESAAESTTRGIETKVLATIGFKGVGLNVIDQTRGDGGFEEEYEKLKKSYTQKLKEKQCLPFYEKDIVKNYYDNKNKSLVRGGGGGSFPSVLQSGTQIKNQFPCGYLPNWYQPTIPSEYAYSGQPIGCGPVAWAMVYAYWKEFKGKSNLFGGYNLRIGDRWLERGYVSKSSDPIYKAMCDIADYCQTDNNGSTFIGNKYLGLKYAGYPDPITCYSTGVFVWTNGYNNPDGVLTEIENDRPVMLSICSSGAGPLDHAVVIDGMIKEYWNNNGAITQIRYHVNFGHGNVEKWIHFYYDGYTSIYDAFFVRL